MTHPTLDVDHWDDDIADAGIVIADGYHVTITVRNGHLTITDGTPSQRRVRRYPRAKQRIVRVVNLGTIGYVTLEAYRWMQGCGITYSGMHECAWYQDWQAVSGQVHGSVECMRYLIGEKIMGQAENLALLGCPDVSARVQNKLGMLSVDTDIINAEIGASVLYWNTWAKKVAIPWRTSDAVKIPQHWTVFSKRRSKDSNRGATDPLNAMLNYGYRIGENACRDACVTVGLSLVHGLIHASRDHRHAFVYDVLEVLRPEIDRRVFGFLRTLRGFDRHWCHETGKGTVVLDPPLTHRIASWEAELYDKVLPVTVECARILRKDGAV